MAMNTIKILGYIATAVGIGASIFSGWVSDKRMDKEIEEQVNKALADKEKKEES